MPPPHHPKKHHAARHSRARREASLDGAALDAALRHAVPDARDRAFVLRCILEEGPRHHRVASWAILRMLAAVLADLGDEPPRAGEDDELVPLPMRLPPSVEESTDDAYFPISLPTKTLGAALTEAELVTALDSLTDGPPHHALANAAMVALIDAIHRRLPQAPR